VVYIKRLERGSFELPDPAGQAQVRVDPTLLHLLLQGIDLGAPRRSWFRREHGSR